MKKSFYFTLSAIMITFALCISLTIATYYYVKTHQATVDHEQNVLEEHINQLLFALETSEKVIYHFGNDIAEQMQKVSISLNGMYEGNPSFAEWDFTHLSEQFNMDIYIIDELNTIRFSNLEHEIGLDFNSCCSTLAQILEQRRLSNQFFHDGLEVEQATGELKKYSYMSTYDHKYLIQLGIYWKNSGFYNEFQFDNVANTLINDRISAIRLLNISGKPLSNSQSSYTLLPENKKALKQALSTNERFAYESKNDDSDITFLYVPHTSSYDDGYTKNKVIEIVYDKSLLNKQLQAHTNTFILQICFILFFTILLALIITQLFSRPIFLAFHDPLTKLGNRAYLHEYVNKFVLKEKPFTIIIFDIDNFKMVNDVYGHSSGDEVVKQTASLIFETSRSHGYAFRFGGDEFVSVITGQNEDLTLQIVKTIVDKFKLEISTLYPKKLTPLSLSIGIAYSNKHDKHLEDVLNAADKALYEAKKAGKNQYRTCNKEREVPL